jgi:hypothetical protein
MLNKLDYRNLKSTIPLNATKIGRSDLHLIMTTEQNEFLAQLCLWIRVALASATDQNMTMRICARLHSSPSNAKLDLAIFLSFYWQIHSAKPGKTFTG